MILLLIAGCWPWIPTSTDEVAPTDGTDAVTDPTDHTDTDPTDVPTATWRGVLVLEQFAGGSPWARASLCVDGRPDDAWTRRLIDTPGACHVASVASPCLDGTEVAVTLTVGGADGDPLLWNEGLGLHEGEGPVLAARTAFGWRAEAFPEGPATGAWEAMEATPGGDLVLLEGTPGAVGAGPVLGLEDRLVRWEPVDDAWVHVRAVGIGPPYAVVRCLVPASDGQVSLSAELFATWDPQDVALSVSLVRPHEGPVQDALLPVGLDLHTTDGWASVPPP